MLNKFQKKEKMEFQINQKGLGTLKFKVLLLFFLILFGCATVPTKTYDETVSEWKSYKDVAKWMSRHFSYDMEKFKKKYSYDNPMPVRTPPKTFELKSGVCFDAARFAKETLNRIDPSYEAEIVFIYRENIDHFVCSFKKDGKLYIMDYGASYRRLIGVHGPYNSLEDYKKFVERNGPPDQKVLSVTFGWPKLTTKTEKRPGFRLEY
jgi:hypothetical protein